MNKILIFGGTTEGRLLAEYCADWRIPMWISVVSGYGKELLPDCPWVRIHTGAMDQCAISDFLAKEAITLVIDATHPYARMVSREIEAACRAMSVRLVRCLRENGREWKECLSDSVVWVEDSAAAVKRLGATCGPVLLTTGSRDLSLYTALPGYQERLYVRVLPSSKVLNQCEALGISGKHVIAMQGPFSEEMNRALLRQIGAKWMVTKASGTEGGFSEKLSAAVDCGVSVIVVERPQEKGLPLPEVKQLLWEAAFGDGKESVVIPREDGSSGYNESCAAGVYEDRSVGNNESSAAESCENSSQGKRAEKKILLAGIGTGAPGLMTGEVVQAIRNSDVICGAGRMLEAAKRVFWERTSSEQGDVAEKKWFPYYQEDKIMDCIEKRLPGEQVLVLYSGDTGCYSGALKLAQELKRRKLSYEILPGISSVSYLASKLSVPWEDAECLTAHGLELSAETVLSSGKRRMFLLVGGENGAGSFFQKLEAAGGGSLQAAVGENLSYPEERICRGTVSQLGKEHFAPLSLIYLERTEME